MAAIPNQLLEEILSNLPVESLLRFVSVSKRWRSMIRSRHLVEKHMTRHRCLPRRIIFFALKERKDDHEYDIYLKSFVREGGDGPALRSYFLSRRFQPPLRFSGSCDGLVCFNDQISAYVINPATRELRELPPANFQVNPSDTTPSNPIRTVVVCRNCHVKEISRTSVGFGRDNITRTYKVVLLYREGNEDGYITKCEVFSLDTALWRRIDPPIHGVINPTPKPIYKSGCLYWFAYIYEGPGWKLKVIAFDLHKESFHMTPNPGFQDHESYKQLNMFNHEDRDLKVITVSTDPEVRRVWTLLGHDDKWEDTTEAESSGEGGEEGQRQWWLRQERRDAFLLPGPEFLSLATGQEVNDYFESLVSVYQ
ncbi:PREDICTED: putative F-box protein At2g02030 [Tarenaya hassleriana]|uniref:putative F-box protein At2g02030 n=1 Tax=Tarenaya hassleriana TaxID=28532 RepID=UPI00053CA72E|nr:PREDICTED: putative F-box protein At2g02030 [Tarenaya hassleriana]